MSNNPRRGHTCHGYYFPMHEGAQPTGKLYEFDGKEQTLIDPDPGYTYAEWTAYLDGLLQGLKAAERHGDGEA